MKEQIVKWLRSLPGVSNVKPVTLAIGKQTWKGAVYTTQDRDRRYYLVGDRPRPERKTCYRFASDHRDWYVESYLDNYDDLHEAQKEYHPFGNHWLLSVWDVPGRPFNRIDDGLPEYHREHQVDVEIG